VLLRATEELAKAVALSQHHDAITGTEKQHVANDYHKRLDKGISSFLKEIETTYCPYLNISQCHLTDNEFEEVTLVLFNPLAHTRSSLVHLPVKLSGSYEVRDQDGKTLEHQLTPLPDEVKKIPGRDSSADFDLAFMAQVPPLQVQGFTIMKLKTNKIEDSSFAVKVVSKSTDFENDGFKIPTNAGDYLVRINKEGFSLSNSKLEDSITHQFAYYKGFQGNNTDAFLRSSGAYIFRPLEQEPIVLDILSFTLYSGPLYNELQFEYKSSASLVVRIPVTPTLYDAEYEWLVGPIPVDDGVGKEYISRWKINGTFEQEGIFYTDANGRQTMERKRDFRPSYEIGNGTVEEPVTSNYYPINSAIFIRDPKEELQLTVVNDRAQGGSSLRDGEVEVMMHRRLLFDDSFGVSEPLNEEAYNTGLVARGKHFFTFDKNIEEANAKRRQLSNEVNGELLYMFIDQSGFEKLRKLLNPKKVNTPRYKFPINVNLLTFEPWLNTSFIEYVPTQYLVRFEHLFEEGEHSVWSKPVSIPVQEFFGPSGLNIGTISFIKETTLGGNQWKEDREALQWKIKGEKEEDLEWKINEKSFQSKKVEESVLENIVLEPLEIRTFIIEFLEVEQFKEPKYIF